MQALTNDRLFFEYISTMIENLADSYTFACSEIENQLKKDLATADSIDYTLIVTQLNRAIDAFKIEMQECLQDYFRLKTENILNEQHAARYIQDNLSKLQKQRDRLVKLVSESDLKAGLGHNYYFHKNIKKLTPDAIMHYFEINYTLSLKKKEG